MMFRIACVALLVAAASCATLPENLHLTAEAPLLELAAAKVSQGIDCSSAIIVAAAAWLHCMSQMPINHAPP